MSDEIEIDPETPPLAALKIRLFLALSDKTDCTENEASICADLSFDPDVIVWCANHFEGIIDD